MKRNAIRLAGGLLLLVVAGPAFADPALGGDDDPREGYRGRQSEHRGWDRGPVQPESADRNRAAQRPLGTQHDDSRQFDDDRYRRDGDRYGGRFDNSRDRYGRDARRAAEAVRRDERGRVLSSEPMDDRGYRVRVLTPDGYVRERYVDPRDDYDDRRRRLDERRRRD